MDLQRVKELIVANSIFVFMDDATGTLEVPDGEFHDIEYGSSAFFPEGGLPPAPPNRVRTERWDEVRLRLRGQTEEHIAKAYLEGLYKALLNRKPNCDELQLRSISSENDLNNLFEGFPGQFTDSPCLITSGSDFSRLLGVLYGDPALRLQIGLGRKYHNRDLLSYGEPLIQFSGQPAFRLVTTERSAVVFNLPQAIEPIPERIGDYTTTLQMKIVRPDLLRVYEVPAAN